VLTVEGLLLAVAVQSLGATRNSLGQSLEEGERAGIMGALLDVVFDVAESIELTIGSIKVLALIHRRLIKRYKLSFGSR
jgi:hypothetical protein